MNKKLKKIGVVLLLALVSISCVNLKHVNEFSSSSAKSLKSIKKLDYSFEKGCLINCRDEKINNLKVNEKKCDCENEKAADSITLKIYNSLYGYFNGLAKLSNDEITAYKTEELETALIEGDFGPITIEEKHVKSYSKISEVLIKAFTNNYRRQKIREYIKQANSSIKELISLLELNISINLKGTLNNKKQNILRETQELLKDNSLSTNEKRKITRDYYLEISNIENQQKKLDAYGKALMKISEGHDKLHKSVGTLKAKELKLLLFQYASEIKMIINELKK